MKLKIGDKVKIKNCSCQWKGNCYSYPPDCQGKEGIIKNFSSKIEDRPIIVRFDTNSTCSYNKKELIKIKK